MDIGDIVWKKQGGEWEVVSIPDESGWFLAKRNGLIFECHVSDFIYI
jgi:hypothetical protein